MRLTQRHLKRIILEAFQDDYGGTPYFAQRGGKLGRTQRGGGDRQEEAQLYDAISNPMEIVRKEISEMSDEREVRDYLQKQAEKGYISADDVYGFEQWHLRSGGGMNATDIQDYFELSTPLAGRWLYRPGSAASGFYKSLNEMKKITKRQLKKIIREEYSKILNEAYNENVFDDDLVSPLKGSRSTSKSPYNTDNRGHQWPLESDVRTAYRQGRSTEEGEQTHGIVDELWALKNEPETFVKIPTKEMFLADHAKYSPSVPKKHVEWLWNYYMVLGREL